MNHASTTTIVLLLLTLMKLNVQYFDKTETSTKMTVNNPKIGVNMGNQSVNILFPENRWFPQDQILCGSIV